MHLTIQKIVLAVCVPENFHFKEGLQTPCLMTTSLTIFQNLENLIIAFGKINNLKSARFNIIGDGSNLKNLKQLAKESDLKIVSQKYDSIIVRWFVPFIKILITNNNGTGNILDSKLYQFYFKYLRPIEELSSTLLPSLFAFRLGMSLERK